MQSQKHHQSRAPKPKTIGYKLTRNNLIFAAVIAATLSACDSEDGGVIVVPNNTDTQPLSLVGLLKIEPNSTDADFSRALFGQLATPLTAGVIEDYFAPTIDTCEVTRSDGTTINPNPNFLIYDERPTLISAGQNITISSDAGTYATLDQQSTELGPYYQTNVQLSGNAPSGMTADIPGDQFPAFPEVALLDVPALEFTSPAIDEDVTPTTQFTWVANNVERSVIEINTSATDTTNNQTVDVNCTVVDDGSFSFPDNIQSEMGADFDDNWSSYLRITYNVVQSETAILFVANSVQF